MKRFKNMTFHEEITLAIKSAERLLDFGSPMIEHIRKKNDFKYDSGSGYNVSLTLLIPRKEILVFTYSPKNPFSAAIGYFDGKAIFLNARKLPSMHIQDIVANLVHEYAHYCSYHHTDPGFWGKRRANYKTDHKCQFSVPYYLSENVGRWL